MPRELKDRQTVQILQKQSLRNIGCRTHSTLSSPKKSQTDCQHPLQLETQKYRLKDGQSTAKATQRQTACQDTLEIQTHKFRLPDSAYIVKSKKRQTDCPNPQERESRKYRLTDGQFTVKSIAKHTDIPVSSQSNNKQTVQILQKKRIRNIG